MSRIKTMILLATVDERARRKKNRMFSIFLTLAMTGFLLLHSGLGSLVENIEDIINKPYGRTLMASAIGEDYQEDMELVKEKLADVEGVGQIFWGGNIFAEWLNAGAVGAKEEEVHFYMATDALSEYTVDGEQQLKEGQVLAPKYLFDIGQYDKYNYLDGKELIGSRLRFRTENINTGETTEYEFEVVGTYDNIKVTAGGMLFCICEADMLNMYQATYCGGAEEYIREILDMGYSLEEIGEVEDNYTIGIYVLPEYDLAEVMHELEEILEEPLFVFVQGDETMVHFYEFIIRVCDIIMGMLAITAFIALVALVMQELRERKGEMALRYALGYTKGIQYSAFLLEKAMLLGRGIVVSLIVTGVAMVATNYMVQNIISFYYRTYRFGYDEKAVALVILVGVIGIFTAAVMSLLKISNISIAQTLKQEGRR